MREHSKLFHVREIPPGIFTKSYLSWGDDDRSLDVWTSGYFVTEHPSVETVKSFLVLLSVRSPSLVFIFCLNCAEIELKVLLLHIPASFAYITFFSLLLNWFVWKKIDFSSPPWKKRAMKSGPYPAAFDNARIWYWHILAIYSKTISPWWSP